LAVGEKKHFNNLHFGNVNVLKGKNRRELQQLMTELQAKSYHIDLGMKTLQQKLNQKLMTVSKPNYIV